MANQTTDNLEVTRDAHIGGNQTVEGDGHVKGNLRVDGWLEAPNIKGPNKGMFQTEAELKGVYPDAIVEDGWLALVGDTLPADIWLGRRGGWVKTGQKGGTILLDLSALDLLGEEVRAAKADASAAKTTANNAQKTADAANTKSGDAQKSASSAQEAASSALSAAGSAQAIASNAKTTADNANATAEEAKTAADNAMQAAEAAVQAAANVLPQVMLFDGFTDYSGEIETESPVSPGAGAVLFSRHHGMFVFTQRSGSILTPKYYASWPGMVSGYNDGMTARSGVVFIDSGSFRHYISRSASGVTWLQVLNSPDAIAPDFYTDLWYDKETDETSWLVEGVTLLRIDCRPDSTDERREDPAPVLYTEDDCIVYDRSSTRFCHRRVTRGTIPGVYPPQEGVIRVEYRNRWIGDEAWGEFGSSGAVPVEGRTYYCNRLRVLYIFSRNYGRDTYNFEAVQAPEAQAQALSDNYYEEGIL